MDSTIKVLIVIMIILLISVIKLYTDKRDSTEMSNTKIDSLFQRADELEKSRIDITKIVDSLNVVVAKKDSAILVIKKTDSIAYAKLKAKLGKIPTYTPVELELIMKQEYEKNLRSITTISNSQ